MRNDSVAVRVPCPQSPGRPPPGGRLEARANVMNSIIYLVGLIVIVLAILSLVGIH
jgi:hypothetical protein